MLVVAAEGLTPPEADPVEEQLRAIEARILILRNLGLEQHAIDAQWLVDSLRDYRSLAAQ